MNASPTAIPASRLASRLANSLALLADAHDAMHSDGRIRLVAVAKEAPNVTRYADAGADCPHLAFLAGRVGRMNVDPADDGLIERHVLERAANELRRHAPQPAPEAEEPAWSGVLPSVADFVDVTPAAPEASEEEQAKWLAEWMKDHPSLPKPAQSISPPVSSTAPAAAQEPEKLQPGDELVSVQQLADMCGGFTASWLFALQKTQMKRGNPMPAPVVQGGGRSAKGERTSGGRKSIYRYHAVREWLQPHARLHLPDAWSWEVMDQRARPRLAKKEQSDR